MISSEVIEIARLIWVDLSAFDLDDSDDLEDYNTIVEAAQRIWNAGYRKTE